MAVFINAGKQQVRFGTAAPADPSAPTAAEVNAATDITPFLVEAPDTPDPAEIVDAGTLAARYTPQQIGVTGGEPIVFPIYRHRARVDDVGFTTLAPDTAGTLYVLYIDSGATPAASDRVDVYAVEIASRNPINPARGDLRQAEVTMAVTAVPNIDVDVAA